ncbi:LmrA/YxaF family transcription factor [Streptomyces sp. NPDC055005]
MASSNWPRTRSERPEPSTAAGCRPCWTACRTRWNPSCTLEAAANDIASTDCAAACPIGTVALEVAGSDEVPRVATAEVFEAWVDAATQWFGRRVAEPEMARSLAYSMVMMPEGAFMLSRAARDTEPLRVAGRSMAQLYRTARPRTTEE